jgi:hypothetical protein
MVSQPQRYHGGATHECLLQRRVLEAGSDLGAGARALVDVASHHSVILTRAIALYGRSLAVFLMAVLIGIGLGLAILAWLLMRRLMSRSQV